MKKSTAALSGFCLSLLLAQAVSAHHSAAIFDFTKPQHLAGVVKEIRVINPHTTLTLEVTDAKGTRPIVFEGHSVNNFYRAGWRPNMVKVGDKIQVTFAGRKDGTDGGFVTGFVTESGQDIGFKPPGDVAAAPPAGAPAAAPMPKTPTP
jgi:hypothetical protein